MKNAEWMIKNGYKFNDLFVIKNCTDNDFYYTYKITLKRKTIDTYKVTSETSWLEIMLRWLDIERKEPIIDDVEKRYLKGVIRPFRDRVQSISKEGNSIVEWLSFKLVNNAPFELPFFKSGRMYKNMERGKEYTLEELGL